MGQGASVDAQGRPIPVSPHPNPYCQIRLINDSDSRLAVWMGINGALVFQASMDPGQWYTSNLIAAGQRWDGVCVSHKWVHEHNATWQTNYHPEALDTMLTANFRRWEGWLVCTSDDFGNLYEELVI